MADDAIDAARDQLVSRLDRDQTAEAMAEHKDRPEPQRSAGREEEDTEPANGVAVDRRELLAVGVGRLPVSSLSDVRRGRPRRSAWLRTGRPAQAIMERRAAREV